MKNLIIKSSMMLLSMLFVTFFGIVGCTDSSSEDPINTPTTSSDTVVGDVAVFEGVVGNVAPGSARLTREGETVDVTDATVEAVTLDESGNEEVVAGEEGDVTVNADGTFEINVPIEVKFVFIRITFKDGKVKRVFFAGTLKKNETITVEPITDESDMQADIVENEIKEGTDPEEVEAEEISDWVDPEVANQVIALDKEVRDCVVEVFRKAFEKAREAFVAALEDKDITGEEILEITSKLKDVRDKMREARKELAKTLHAAIKEGDKEAYLKAREDFRDQIEAIHEEAGIPRIVFVKTQQLAQEAFERAIFASAETCNIPDSVLRIMHVKSIIRVFNHDLKATGFTLNKMFSYDVTGFKAIFDTLIETVKAFDYESPIDEDLKAAYEAFYGSLLTEIKTAIDDTWVTDEAIQTLFDAITTSLDTLKTSLDSATTEMEANVAFKKYHKELRIAATEAFGLDAEGITEEEKGKKLALFDILLMLHHPIKNRV